MTKDEFKKEILIGQKKNQDLTWIFYIKHTSSNSIKWLLVLLLK